VPFCASCAAFFSTTATILALLATASLKTATMRLRAPAAYANFTAAQILTAVAALAPFMNAHTQRALVEGESSCL